MRSNIIMLALTAALAAALVPGCGRKRAQPVSMATPPLPDRREAYWRRQYLNNRPVPPELYSVPPRPPRNNEFGEFVDSLHHGLDAQPPLPALPGRDLQPLPPSSMPSGFPEGGPRGSGIIPAAAAPAGAAPVAPPAPDPFGGAPAGVTYYPVEQLIYGGDYPDLDAPEEYRLMPKDAITIAVRDHPEFSGPVEVQPDGTVRVPHTPDLVRLRGLTAAEAAEAIRKTVAPYVKGECLVRVQANRARGGYYFVFGDVLQPGRFPLGAEPVRLSEAVLAANWEASTARLDADGDDLGPSFPAASPRGKYIAPRSADMARVMLITPHRSKPVRTWHDARSALLGMTGDDPVIRPGQIIVVPSLDPRQNALWGLDAAAAPPSAKVFLHSDAPAVLPPAGIPALPLLDPAWGVPEPDRSEENMELTKAMAERDPETTAYKQGSGDAYVPYQGAERRGRRKRWLGW